MDNFLLPPATRLQHVRLRVADADRALTFYRDLLGFGQRPAAEATLYLAAPDADHWQVALVVHPGARPKPWRTAGLYHVAILLPSRRDLARVVHRLLSHGWPLDGASDHGVSEALYLRDPDRNGLELYADRPREHWPFRQGELAMVTVPLDLEGLLATVGPVPPPWTGLPPGTRVGHVHLQVSDLRRAEAFYCGLLGFVPTQRSYPGALFVAIDGYHHHVGLNVWAGEGVPPAPPDAAGLIAFGLRLPDRSTWEQLARRLERAGLPLETPPADQPGIGLLVRDPDGIGVELWGPAADLGDG